MIPSGRKSNSAARKTRETGYRRTAEDVNEDTLDLGVGDDDLERFLDGLGSGTSAFA